MDAPNDAPNDAIDEPLIDVGANLTKHSRSATAQQLRRAADANVGAVIVTGCDVHGSRAAAVAVAAAGRAAASASSTGGGTWGGGWDCGL